MVIKLRRLTVGYFLRLYRTYKPAKDTCIALSLALQLSLSEANDILSRAVYLSVGQVDRAPKDGRGVNIHSTEAEIVAMAEYVRDVIEHL